MLKGKRVRLRALEREDVERCHRWLNDEVVTKYLGWRDPLSMVEEERWFEEQSSDKSRLVLAIEVEGNHIGNIGLHDIDFRNGKATIGIIIGEKGEWGKGYGSEAMCVLLRYAFEDLRLHRVGSFVLVENMRSIRCLEKSGFVREGMRRGVIFRFGRHLDAILFGILRDEFRKGD